MKYLFSRVHHACTVGDSPGTVRYCCIRRYRRGIYSSIHRYRSIVIIRASQGFPLALQFDPASVDVDAAYSIVAVRAGHEWSTTYGRKKVNAW